MGLLEFLGLKRKLYSGGDGSSNDCAVIIHAKSTLIGVPAEYAWLEKHFGKRDVDWSIGFRSHGGSDNGKVFETYHINLVNGTTKTVVFDITSFYGCF